MSEVLGLACELVRRRSLTPDDAGCQELVARRLAAAGFSIERLRHGRVDNLLALHGQGSPCLLLLGHTDVVPTGPEQDWSTPPFEPVVRDGVLHGRGAADMKGSVAAFVVAAERFVAEHPRHPGTLAILLTSDEEGDAVDGVRRVAAQRLRGGAPRIDWCLVGEPSSRHELGDVVRIGRRGSLTGTAEVHGVQGHVAYPERARNPIHAVLPALVELAARVWDPEPFPDFPGTGFQIAGFQAGTGASNVIPGSARLQFNLRYSPRWDAQALIAEIEACFARHGAEVTIHWDRSGEPFHTAQGPLRAAVREAIGRHCGRIPEEDTGGGTSDGRFLAPLGAEVVELGPVNASIHKVDEQVRVDELDRLVALYSAIVERLLG
ncbi:MAG TPA: succinyl-diaminopimelate desuccinylase [Xanthomonadaceae bacterium]|nr:succinyl-diaminopimelate desuccinylase [Xanthomonadaceae bacterium]